MSSEPTALPKLYLRERMVTVETKPKALAEKMDTSEPQISRLVNGQRKMSLEWLYAFSQALDVPIADLFHEPGSNTGKVRGETSVKDLLRRIDGLPDDAIQPIWRVISGFIEDGGQPGQDRLHGQSEPATPHRVKEPSR